MVRRLTWIAVCLLIIGCGKLRQPYMEWPAKVASIEGASERQRQLILDAIETVNTQVGTPVLTLDGDGYPIHIRIVPPSPQNPLRVGYAVSSTTECRVELLNRLFDENYYLDLLVSVFAHEAGHCAGLEHVQPSNEVMSRSAIPFNSYSPGALSRFANELRAAITF